MNKIASSPLKLILFGEHSVLIGGRCLSLCINRYCSLYLDVNYEKEETLNILVSDVINSKFILSLGKDIKIEKSDLKHDGLISIGYYLGCGLGSSAAVSLLSSAALYKIYDQKRNVELQSQMCDQKYDQKNDQKVKICDQKMKICDQKMNIDFYDQKMENDFFNQNTNNDEIYRKADFIENVFHGKSSGVDCATLRFGGLISFKDKKVKRMSTEFISKYKILIYNSKIQKDTAKTVKQELNDKENNYNKLKQISEEAYNLISKEFQLKDFYNLIRRSQDIFEDLGVVPNKMKEEVRKLRKNGIESKITGAGNGGHLFTLVDKDHEIKDWEEVKIDYDGFQLN